MESWRQLGTSKKIAAVAIAAAVVSLVVLFAWNEIVDFISKSIKVILGIAGATAAVTAASVAGKKARAERLRKGAKSHAAAGTEAGEAADDIENDLGDVGTGDMRDALGRIDKRRKPGN